MPTIVGEWTVTCPVCGADYAHPIRVSINSGGAITVVDAGGAHSATGVPSGRGVQIEIEFDTEQCGHVFTLEYQFHKGQTLASVASEDVSGQPRTLNTIWRD